MELIKKNLISAQIALSKIEARKEMVYYEYVEKASEDDSPVEDELLYANRQNDGYFDSFDYLIDFQGSDTLYIKGEGVRFYGADGKTIYTDELIKGIKSELFENLRVQDNIEDKKKYVKEIIELFSSIEDSIIEDEQKILITDFITYKDFTLDELDKRARSPAQNFIDDLKSSLREALTEIYPIYNDLICNNEVEVKTGNRLVSQVSFYIIDKDILYREEFKTFFEELKVEYLRCDDIRNFRKVFSGQPITDKVIWKGDKGALKYLIRRLINNGIIESPSYAFYNTTAYCFKYESSDIDPKQLSHEHEPSSKKVIDDLTEILEPLIELKGKYQK